MMHVKLNLTELIFLVHMRMREEKRNMKAARVHAGWLGPGRPSDSPYQSTANINIVHATLALMKSRTD